MIIRIPCHPKTPPVLFSPISPSSFVIVQLEQPPHLPLHQRLAHQILWTWTMQGLSPVSRPCNMPVPNLFLLVDGVQDTHHTHVSPIVPYWMPSGGEWLPWVRHRTVRDQISGPRACVIPRSTCSGAVPLSVKARRWTNSDHGFEEWIFV